jgi:hypothetical protein
MTSARIKPFSMSEWILPAAAGALVPAVTVQARHSYSPEVKNGSYWGQILRLEQLPIFETED